MGTAQGRTAAAPAGPTPGPPRGGSRSFLRTPAALGAAGRCWTGRKERGAGRLARQASPAERRGAAPIGGDGRASRPERPGPARGGSASISHGAAAQSRRGGGGALGAGARLSRPRSASLPRRRRRRTRGDPGGGGGSGSRLGCSVSAGGGPRARAAAQAAARPGRWGRGERAAPPGGPERGPGLFFIYGRGKCLWAEVGMKLGAGWRGGRGRARRCPPARAPARRPRP